MAERGTSVALGWLRAMWQALKGREMRLGREAAMNTPASWTADLRVLLRRSEHIPGFGRFDETEDMLRTIRQKRIGYSVGFLVVS